MPALKGVILLSSQHKIKRKAAGQGDPGVEGNLGRGLEGAAAGQAIPREGEEPPVLCLHSEEEGAAALTFAALQPGENEEVRL